VIQNIFSEYSELRLRKANSNSEVPDMASIVDKKKQSLKDTLAQEAWQHYGERKGVEIKKSSEGFIKPTKGKTK
jgi:hypothetical protein